jgi:hypothetical protein
MPQASSKAGFAKIRFCCDQALKDGLGFVWVDTCCIDKTSSTELSEAINSMYRWYKNAEVCYAYLRDISVAAEYQVNNKFPEIDHSRWFKRVRLPNSYILCSNLRHLVVSLSQCHNVPDELLLLTVDRGTQKQGRADLLNF